jgi:hypothetical protein
LDGVVVGSHEYCGLAAGCPKGGAVLGVIDAEINLLIEKIPQSSNSHSVAADCKRNTIFVPQVAPASVVGSGGDTTTVGQLICGQATNGCVAVYQHKVPGRCSAENENNQGNEDNQGDNQQN